jgi:hypothetical protein
MSLSFKSKMRYLFLRNLVKWRNWRKTIDNKMTAERSVLSPTEEKAIRLWKILLRDEETHMSYNSLGVRQIEKENIFMIFQPGSNSGYIMTLMDVNEESRSLYELHIPPKHSDIVADNFDDELERRMKRAENNKRSIIETDIDILLRKEEKILIDKKAKKKAI